MKAIRVYRNPHCARCARFAKAYHVLDWFGKVDPSTDTPRTGPLRMGEVVVEDLSNGQIHRGADGIELIARNIPASALPRLRSRWGSRDVRCLHSRKGGLG